MGDGEPTDQVPDDASRSVELSSAAERLLKDVIEHPFKRLTERYDAFANAYQGNKAKDQLVENGITVERPLTGERGKLLELTERGREYAATELDLNTEHRGRGGIVHRYWRHRIQESFEAAGWPAKRELFDADVYVNTGKEELVVEVAMGNNQREIEHIEQHLNRGIDRILVACPSKDVRDGLRQRLAEHDLLDDQVTVRLFREIGDAEHGSF